MTGFIRGLFGGRKRQSSQPSQAFYLDSDEAKTLGNLDYMRTPITIKRTYAKSVGSPEEKELVQQVSAESKTTIAGTAETAAQRNPKTSGQMSSQSPSFSSSSSTSSFSQSEAGQRRRTDSGMDMFRQMAKDIKKR